MEKKRELNIFELQSRQRIQQLIYENCDGSQQVFSDRTGINKGSVSQYINGKNSPSHINAKKIAEAFNIAPAWVMGYDVGKDLSTINPDSEDSESSLLNLFRELTQEGKNKVLDYINDLHQNIKYSAKQQEFEKSLKGDKKITSIGEAMQFLKNADIPLYAFSNGKVNENDIIAIANSIRQHSRI